MGGTRFLSPAPSKRRPTIKSEIRSRSKVRTKSTSHPTVLSTQATVYPICFSPLFVFHSIRFPLYSLSLQLAFCPHSFFHSIRFPSSLLSAPIRFPSYSLSTHPAFHLIQFLPHSISTSFNFHLIGPVFPLTYFSTDSLSSVRLETKG